MLKAPVTPSGALANKHLIMATVGYVKPEATGLAAGLHTAFIVTRHALPRKPSYRKGHKSACNGLIKEVIREVEVPVQVIKEVIKEVRASVGLFSKK